MEINSRILKLQGQVEIPEDLDMDTSYKIVLDGEVKKTEESSNDDGTFNRIFKFIPILGDIIGQNGKVTKTKDARRRSQQLRACIRQQFMMSGSDMDEDTFYDRKMQKIIGKVIDGSL